jgi:glutathione S-transferase
MGYDTFWVEGKEIESTLRPMGFKPTRKLEGREVWTVPCLKILPSRAHDSEILLSESRSISKYLDSTYPETRRVNPSVGSQEYVHHEKLFEEFCNKLPLLFGKLVMPAYDHMMGPGCVEGLDQAYGKQMFGGVPMKEALRNPEERKAFWSEIRGELSNLARSIDDVREKLDITEGPYIFGKDPTFADVTMIANFLWVRACPQTEMKEYTLDGILLES